MASASVGVVLGMASEDCGEGGKYTASRNDDICFSIHVKTSLFGL
jgi:hypothetical protein